MIIVGAKGFAKEVLEIIYQLNLSEEVFFYDNVSSDMPSYLFDKFKVLRSFEEVSGVFENVSRKFTIGIGNPSLRYAMFREFKGLGGVFTSTISPYANIGHFGNNIAHGVNIMTGTVITNDISIKRGAVINLNCTVGHDTVIGQFAELSPGVHISGRCNIGDLCNIGTGAVILPDVSLGTNVVVGAGAVVNKNVPKNSLVVGVPAKIVKEIDAIEL